MGGFIRHKPVDNRKNRPEWVMDDKALIECCFGGRGRLRWDIAVMYWRENKSAREIAIDLGLTVDVVKKIIQRLAKKQPTKRDMSG